MFNQTQHATTAVPQKGGLEDVHVVFTGDNSSDQRAMFTPSFLWHSDVCESTYHPDPLHQPNHSLIGDIRNPTTILHITEAPDGPTAWGRR